MEMDDHDYLSSDDYSNEQDMELSSVVPSYSADSLQDGMEDHSIHNIPDLTTDTSVSKVVPNDAFYEINDDNRWGWITLYVVTIVVAVLGNLLFIVSSLCTRRSHNTGHYLLINLSLRDILLAGLCIPFTLDSEIIHLTWNLGLQYCISFRFFYYCFLFVLPLTCLFLSYHLFAENCKWNFSEDVSRPWSHTLYLPIIWLLAAAFAVPNAFFTDLRKWEDDPYKNLIAGRPDDAVVCMHKAGDYADGSNFFYFASFVLTFVAPVVLLFIPWWGLLVQSAACCTRKLRRYDLWLSIITLFLILIFETSRAPFELFNIHYVLTNWEIGIFPIDKFLEFGESYIAVMKWAVYAPTMIHPFLYFMFCADARHGLAILFRRLCPCCLSKSSGDIVANSDDEKNKMLPEAASMDQDGSQEPLQPSNIPLQSKEEDQM